MSTIDATDLIETEQRELDFLGDERLNEAVASGTYYYMGDLVFVVFLLNEATGYTLCWAKGDLRNSPTGESFERAQTFPNLEEAQAELAKTESFTLDFFNSLSREMASKQ